MKKNKISSFCWACGHSYSIELGHICSKPKDYIEWAIKKNTNIRSRGKGRIK